MAVETVYVSHYDRRIRLVADALTQNSKLTDEAAVELAKHVLNALDHIPEKGRSFAGVRRLLPHTIRRRQGTLSVPISTVHQPAQPGRTATAPRPRPTAIGMVSTYPPTQCGLATFSAALIEHLHLSPKVSLGVVQVVDEVEPRAGRDVVGQLVNGSADSAGAAVRRLNGFDAVVVQHEYGIYGGPDGIDVLDIVDALTVPAIVVMHTVLQDPTYRQRHILLRLLATADVVVTLTQTARRRLIATYGADPAQLVVIPHGAVDHGCCPRSSATPTPVRSS